MRVGLIGRGGVAAEALKGDPGLETFSGHVSDSGEGRRSRRSTKPFHHACWQPPFFSDYRRAASSTSQTGGYR